jgi:lipoprotein-anchoring transpeptidase ErfK/SrfK
MQGRLRAVAWAAAGLILAGCDGVPPQPAAPLAQAQPSVPASPAQFNGLLRATTFARLTGLPDDPSPFAVTDGQVVHPLTEQPIYAAPGGHPVAVLPATELGDPTWVPVIQAKPGWARVLLPSRPNHVTGWIFAGGAAGKNFVVRFSSYLVQVDIGARRLSVTDDGRSLGTWTVAAGATATPTPTGRTFVLAYLQPLRPTYSPLILPLGAHSDTLDSFAGGPGTVALHGWPDPAVFGHLVSHGCVRVPSQALRVLSRVPLGSLVLITR